MPTTYTANEVIESITDASGTIRLENLDFDFDRYMVRIDGRPIHLTYFQFRALGLLVRKRNKAVSREELCRELWGEPTPERNLRLNSQVSRLRQRLESVAAWSIVTIPQFGYILSNDYW
ncbi:MAG: winged helix-turn-helix domain-containing protein [Chloroflexota bacterium]